jgi:REP element-mobilizing transposase RayT
LSEPGAVATGLFSANLCGMWNDTDIALAYLITFRTYGTWLHGDVRGSVDRNNNVYNTTRIEHHPARSNFERTLLNREPVALDAAQRTSAEFAIRETSEKRGWRLYALNVRTNHIHCVVSIGDKRPEIALNAFKANATRQMRADGCWSLDKTPWAEKGSKRYLWNEKALENAINYVIYGQGDDLPNFD